MRYDIDRDAAKLANAQTHIAETGKYIGTFNRAEMVTSQKGTVGVEFSFESDNKQTADYLTIWTINQDGKHIYGYNILMAIMTCLKLRSIETQKQTIDKYDPVAKKVLPTQAIVYPDLTDKRIGVLLQMEEYENGKKEIRKRPVLFAVFDADTELTAAEILDRKVTPEKLPKMVAQLQPLKQLKVSSSPSLAYSGSARTLSDMDDDIPF